MKNKQFSVLNNGGGYSQSRLCKIYKQALAMVSALTMLFTTATFFPNNTFNLVREITASANSTLQKVANADSAWLEVGADFTYEINGTTYNCIVASSTQNEAVVIWKNVQNPDNDFLESKQSMILSCEEKGGRLIKFAEYQVLSEHGIINTTNNHISYGCKEYDVCDCIDGIWHWDSSYNWTNWSYFIAFELKRNPIKTVSDSLVKTHADPTLSTAKGENFTWQGDCEIKLTYYDLDMIKLDDVPTGVGDYYVKASVPPVVVTENGEEIRYEASESNYFTFKIGHNYVNGKCTVCGTFADGIGANLAGHSISLDGNIGVNFYMELDESVVKDENAYMQFTLPNGHIQAVNVSDAKQTPVDEKIYYVFSCNVAAKEMFDTIKAQIISGDKKGKVYEYSVMDYADCILRNPDNYDDKTVELVREMLYYGQTADLYFSSSIIKSDSGLDKVTADTLKKFEKQTNGTLPDGIEYYGSSLLLESETTVRHYFKAAKGISSVIEYGFSGYKNGYYYTDITGISAANLGTPQTTTIGDWSISYSPMSYAYDVLNSDTASDNLKNLVKALYLYNQAAEAYQNK
ncbi:MAG: hypothetical protein K2K14_00810 [Ruminococcus sp.]|nr:hypothetical protein [Ruminococcus sp.]